MKDSVKKAIGALLAVLALMVLWGCDKVKEDKDKKDDTDMTGKNNNTVESLPVSGRWGDMYSETYLEFDGDIMYVIWGEYKDKYKVKAQKDGTYTEIVNTDEKEGTGFGVMSRLTLKDDGTMTAYEQILDAEGHTYIFVPEEKLEEARAIKDFSEDLPKNIDLSGLKYFSINVHSYYLEGRGSGRFSWTVEKQEDGSFTSEINGMGDSYVILMDTRTVDQSFVDGLIKLIEDEKLLERNGFFKSTRKEDSENSVYAKFESKERLSIRVGSEALSLWGIDNDKFFGYAISAIPKEELE
ncbi:MAG: hypothetical protein J5783_02825 [Lachnospiraceae bacterium]|nr:hypothetical protein [Lachnospiraceae bacterium]